MHSRIAGTGRYLPAQVLTNDELAQARRHERRVDPHAHRHPRSATSPPPTSRRRDLALARVAQGARRRGHRAGRRRSHHRRDDHARHDLSVDGVHPAGEARRARRSGVRRAGGVLRASSTRWRSPTRWSRRGAGAQCARRRRRDLFAHPRLERSRHVRAVRRWRRRRRAGAVRRARHPDVASARRRPAIATSCACRARSQNGKVTGTPFVHMDGPAVFKFAVKVLAEVGAGGARRRRHAAVRRSTG